MTCVILVVSCDWKCKYIFKFHERYYAWKGSNQVYVWWVRFLKDDRNRVRDIEKAHINHRKNYVMNFYLGHFLQIWHSVSAHWWQVNIVSSNVLVPSGNKPLPAPLDTNYIWYKNMNSWLTKFFRGNKNIHLRFMSFFHIDMTQVIEILPQVRQGHTYST